jgi:hypothetical protein
MNKKILFALVTVFIGAGVSVFHFGGNKGDTAKGVVKSPPPDNKKHKHMACPPGTGVISVFESDENDDEGKEIKIESTDESVCPGNTVCGRIVGPKDNRRFKIHKICK